MVARSMSHHRSETQGNDSIPQGKYQEPSWSHSHGFRMVRNGSISSIQRSGARIRPFGPSRSRHLSLSCAVLGPAGLVNLAKVVAANKADARVDCKNTPRSQTPSGLRLLPLSRFGGAPQANKKEVVGQEWFFILSRPLV